jgi:hypothetical protein
LPLTKTKLKTNPSYFIHLHQIEGRLTRIAALGKGLPHARLLAGAI